jgi:tetratricopeptide (TPR) repeat protein
MKGRILAIGLTLLLLLALLGQTVRWRHRLAASRLLRQVEVLSMAAASAGQAQPRLMAANLEMLRQAAPLDPSEVGIPIARGTQYLFLARPDAALRSYEEALALEPRPETYLNLGRAQWLADRREEARRSFALAVRLSPNLDQEIPRSAR